MAAIIEDFFRNLLQGGAVLQQGPFMLLHVTFPAEVATIVV